MQRSGPKSWSQRHRCRHRSSVPDRETLAVLGRESDGETEYSQLLALDQEAGADAGTASLELLAARAGFLAERGDPRAPEAVERAIAAHVEVLGAEHPDTRRIMALAKSPYNKEKQTGKAP